MSSVCCVTDNLLKTVAVTLPLSSFVIHFDLGQSFNSSHLLLFNLSPWVSFLPCRTELAHHRHCVLSDI